MLLLVSVVGSKYLQAQLADGLAIPAGSLAGGGAGELDVVDTKVV